MKTDKKFKELLKTLRMAAHLRSRTALIAAVVFIVYAQAFFNDFVHDDFVQIVENPWIKDINNIIEIFTSEMGGHSGVRSNYYRPMVNMVWMLDYYIFGLNPWGFHLSYVIFHAGVSILLFHTASRLFGGIEAMREKSFFSASFAASLIFALHPVNTEAVEMAIPDLGAAFFGLFSFYMYTKWSAGSRNGACVLSVVLFLTALLFKETALALLVLFWAYDYVKAPEKESKWRLRIYNFKKYVPYLAVTLIYFLFRFHALKTVIAPVRSESELTVFQFILNSCVHFLLYVRKLFLPAGLSGYYVIPPVMSFTDPGAAVSVLLTLFFLFLAYIYRNNKVVFLSLLLTVLPVIPTFFILLSPQLGENTFADRFVYLPSAGFSMLLAFFLFKVADRKPVFSRLLPALLSFLLLLCAIAVFNRNTVWNDNYTLWKDAIKKGHSSVYSHFNLATASIERGYMDEAMHQREIASELNPEGIAGYDTVYVGRRHNEGLAYLGINQIDKAVKCFKDSLVLSPGFPDSHFELARIYFMKGMTSEAIRHLRIAIEHKPDFWGAYNYLGLVYIETGKAEEAREAIEAAVRIKPDEPSVHVNLARVYYLMGLKEKADKEALLAMNLRAGRGYSMPQSSPKTIN